MKKFFYVHRITWKHDKIWFLLSIIVIKTNSQSGDQKWNHFDKAPMFTRGKLIASKGRVCIWTELKICMNSNWKWNAASVCRFQWLKEAAYRNYSCHFLLIHVRIEDWFLVQIELISVFCCVFSRRFSSEKCPTLTVASFFSFFSSDHRPHRVSTTFYRNW